MIADIVINLKLLAHFSIRAHRLPKFVFGATLPLILGGCGTPLMYLDPVYLTSSVIAAAVYPDATTTPTTVASAPDRVYLGVITDEKFDSSRAASLNVAYATQGLIINAVIDGSPAAKAGLMGNDIITSVDSTPIDSLSMLRWKVSTLTHGATVDVRVLRYGVLIVVPVTF